MCTIAILNPSPGAPRRFSFGIKQFSNIRLQVDDALMPSLSSFFPNENPAFNQAARRKTYAPEDVPGMFFGTRKALIPLCFNALLVVAKTTAASAS